MQHKKVLVNVLLLHFLLSDAVTNGDSHLLNCTISDLKYDTNLSLHSSSLLQLYFTKPEFVMSGSSICYKRQHLFCTFSEIIFILFSVYKLW